jgi:hypothetical protein
VDSHPYGLHTAKKAAMNTPGEAVTVKAAHKDSNKDEMAQ